MTSSSDVLVVWYFNLQGVWDVCRGSFSSFTQESGTDLTMDDVSVVTNVVNNNYSQLINLTRTHSK